MARLMIAPLPALLNGLRQAALVALLVSGLGGYMTSFAKEAEPLSGNPAVEARLQHIAKDMRCLVCQNESLADSQSDLAKDLRRELRGLIEAGQSDEQIRQFMVSRYGNFVLYTPPFQPSTWALWLGPFVLLLAGLAWLVRLLRQRKQAQDAAPLSPEQQRRAAQWLEPEKTEP